MALVDWGGAISIKEKDEVIPDIRNIPWVSLCTPKRSSHIRGNRQQIQQINEWFTNIQFNSSKNSCLFVEGPSGVWKSTAVKLCAKEHGYHVIHTQSDTPRTPQKLDSVLRKLNMVGLGGVLLLDEFESFIKETTALRWLMSLLKSSVDSTNKLPTLVVVVCNAVDKSFRQVRDISTVVTFNSFDFNDLYMSLLSLSQKVASYCNLPPMDCYFVASMSGGNVCQIINQVQVMYYGSKPVSQKKRKRMGKVQSKSMQDSPIKMWSHSHRSTSVDCFFKDEDLLGSVSNMDRDFMNSLNENITRDYILYFHNSSASSLNSMAQLADDISLSDCRLDDMDEDRLYESENSERWSEDNVNFIGCVCRSMSLLRGREKNSVVPKRHIKKNFKFY